MNQPAQKTPFWLIAGIVLVVAILVGGAVAIFAIKSAREVMANAFGPQTQYTAVLRGAIQQLNNSSKLVVLTVDLSADVNVRSSKVWMGIDLGDTVTNVRAPARVQYAVPLDKLSDKDFSFSPATKRLVLAVPPPHLDREMVSIESDPSKLEVKTDVGWARLRTGSGKYTEDTAKQYLKEAAINAGSSELIKDRAEKNAREQLLKLLAPVSSNLAPDVSLDIEFKEKK